VATPLSFCPSSPIGLPVYNGEEFLSEALGRFLAQTFKDFEILICDNASMDRTPQICRDIGDSPIAVKRFWQVLARARWGSHMFGVVRRQALEQTCLLPNFAGSDRPMLAELALLGRFRSSQERLFLKRFHVNVSWALNQKELKSFLSTDGKPYSRRVRQLKAFFSVPRGKPVGVLSKSICVILVAAHCVKITAHILARKEARNAAQGTVWRRDSHLPTWSSERH
jgi:cellulose synthase/poly-beta-1,6-N-acetylglucosamine synthase-like glycosyltransferase